MLPQDVRGMPRAKVPFTAAVLVPPDDIYEPIQAIRREHDPQIARWMPHVTLLYPFVPPEALATAAEAARKTAGSFPSFDVRLLAFDCFIHRGRWATIWLRLDPPAPLIRLHAQLLEQFPWCDDTLRFAGGFTPHLSVGRWPAHEAQAAMAGLHGSWQPLEWRVRNVCLIARPAQRSGPFAVRYILPLDGPPG
jgi:2'-5' RNA ligase